MDHIEIIGGHPLAGSIPISGAKNAALPLMCLGLMTDKDLVLGNMPNISDVLFMQKVLQALGVSIETHNKKWVFSTSRIVSHHTSRHYVSKMRASILALGALLGRHGKARFSVPGGCTIGARPINHHLEGLQAMGVMIDFNQGDILATTPSGRVPGGCYTFPQPTVTGTLNLVFAGVLAQGETVLHNIAKEPEIMDTLHCLKKMGASIEKSGNSLYIQGKDRLEGAVHTILSDRIEMGTYMIAAAITQGDLTLHGDCIEHLSAPIQCLKQMGVDVTIHNAHSVRIFAKDRPKAIPIVTGPFPEFPTDLQAQFMALMCLAKGTSTVTETIWENRFMHVTELARMGADITIQGDKATIMGRSSLQGSSLKATDLRASVSLVLAGLAAQGKTTVHHIHHLDRGYEYLEDKLSSCGATIQRTIHHDVLHHHNTAEAS
jgi:UDP-N-acetylglucosamine 1-carboxyvinyltransferase